MGKPTGFMEYDRQDVPATGPSPSASRDYDEIDAARWPRRPLRQQAARCMDCGIPFCHGAGCPLANRIPEFNDLVYQRPVARGVRDPALDQQLPRDHRADLPRPVRGRLHAGHQRRAR